MYCDWYARRFIHVFIRYKPHKHYLQWASLAFLIKNFQNKSILNKNPK